jgi:hypothetical protein
MRPGPCDGSTHMANTAATDPSIALERLVNQRLVGTTFASPSAAVAAFGAVQAQDYYGACWALAERVRGATAVSVEKAFDRGAILRTHVLRPTWHFVVPASLRWLIELSRASVIRRMALYDRKLGLTPRVYAKSHEVLARALEGGRYRTREELGAILAARGISASGQRLAHFMGRAELDAVITSGPRRGKQFTYALFEERAPNAVSLPREEALAELGRHYFSTHGPAQLADFAWWGGLTLSDARIAVAEAKGLSERVLAERPHWSPRPRTPPPAARSSTLLLPYFDEYLVAYRDARPILAPEMGRKLGPRELLSAPRLVVGGQVVGGWRRVLEPTRVRIEVTTFRRLSKSEQTGVERASAAYARFLGLPVTLAIRNG